MKHVAAIGLIVIVVLFSVFEIRRWRRPDLAEVLTETQKGRRLIGMLLLLIISLLAFGGSFFPPFLPYVPKAIREFELIYFLLLALLTVFLPLIAFFEFKDSLTRASQLRRQVYRDIVTSSLDDLTEVDDDTKKNDT